jgi:HD-GYP domain-containing protein (c-di-GMP phosphodiesterase class II)
MTHHAPSTPIHRLPTSIQDLCWSLEEKSPATAAHCRRVAQTARRLAVSSQRFSSEQLEDIFLAGYLHDLGKLVVPITVLDKPEALNASEWQIIRNAAICGESLIKPFLAPGHALVAAVRSEHERWDGHGYPDGLSGQDIPLISRIVLIADTLDSLRIHSAYRSARGLGESLKVLAQGAGSQFDPEWVDFSLRLWKPEVRFFLDLGESETLTAAPLAHNNHELAF